VRRYRALWSLCDGNPGPERWSSGVDPTTATNRLPNLPDFVGSASTRQQIRQAAGLTATGQPIPIAPPHPLPLRILVRWNSDRAWP